MDGWVNGWTGGRMAGWTDGLMGERTYETAVELAAAVVAVVGERVNVAERQRWFAADTIERRAPRRFQCIATPAYQTQHNQINQINTINQ